MLADALKTLLATEYAFVVKAQFFHWNVEGPDFAQLHEFFGDLYEEVYDNSIDKTAEYIRTLDDYTPGSFQRFAELSQIQGQTRVPRARLMLEELLYFVALQDVIYGPVGKKIVVKLFASFVILTLWVQMVLVAESFKMRMI